MIRARKKPPKNGANITVENDTLHLMWIDLNRNFSIISKNLFIGLLSIYRYSKEGISKIHILLHAWNSPLARVLLAFRIFLHQIFFRIDIFLGFFFQQNLAILFLKVVKLILSNTLLGHLHLWNWQIDVAFFGSVANEFNVRVTSRVND